MAKNWGEPGAPELKRVEKNEDKQSREEEGTKSMRQRIHSRVKPYTIHVEKQTDDEGLKLKHDLILIKS